MAIDHKSRAREAWPVLVKLARSKGEPITYGELCAQLSLHHRAAGYFLGVIQSYCHHNGLPKLQALAVNKQTRVPGVGFAGPRGKSAHNKEVEKVHFYGDRWPLKAPF